MTRSRRLGPMVAAVIVGAFVVAGPAYAADPPPAPGTTECDKKVATDPAVTAAKNETPPDQTAIEAAEKKASDVICTGSADSETPEPPVNGSSADPVAPGNAEGAPDTSNRSNRLAPAPGGNRSGQGAGSPAPNRPGLPAGDRNCPDFATQQQAQQYFLSIGGSPTNNADRLDANHNGIACEDYFDDGDNQEAAVSTTGDDGSEATTSGEQVTDVPEGSAQTGGF